MGRPKFPQLTQPLLGSPGQTRSGRFLPGYLPVATMFINLHVPNHPYLHLFDPRGSNGHPWSTHDLHPCGLADDSIWLRLYLDTYIFGKPHPARQPEGPHRENHVPVNSISRSLLFRNYIKQRACLKSMGSPASSSSRIFSDDNRIPADQRDWRMSRVSTQSVLSLQISFTTPGESSIYTYTLK